MRHRKPTYKNKIYKILNESCGFIKIPALILCSKGHINHVPMNGLNAEERESCSLNEYYSLTKSLKRSLENYILHDSEDYSNIDLLEQVLLRINNG